MGLGFGLCIQSAFPFCFQEAGQRHGISPLLLRAIAEQESGLKANAINRNANGSYDVGVMQINSRWLPTLARYRIDEAMLYDPCVNVHVGAWILAGNFQRMGVRWEALGAYNAGRADLRAKYAASVIARLRRLLRQQGVGLAPA